MTIAKEFLHLRKMREYRITGSKKSNWKVYIPLGHQTFSENIEGFVIEYDEECLSLYRYFLHPDTRDKTIFKFFSDDSILVGGFCFPKKALFIHRCKPKLQDLSSNIKFFFKIPSWGAKKILKPYFVMQIATLNMNKEGNEQWAVLFLYLNKKGHHFRLIFFHRKKRQKTFYNNFSYATYVSLSCSLSLTKNRKKKFLGIAFSALFFLCIAYLNGWHQKFYVCFQVKKDLDIINNLMSKSNNWISLASMHNETINGQLARNQLNNPVNGSQNGQRVSFGPDEIYIPLPYYSTETLNSKVLNPSAPRRVANAFSESIPNIMDLQNDACSNYTSNNNWRAGSFLSFASVLHPVYNRPKLFMLSCNLGHISDKGFNLRDFVFSIFDPKWWCTGHLQKS